MGISDWVGVRTRRMTGGLDARGGGGTGGGGRKGFCETAKAIAKPGTSAWKLWILVLFLSLGLAASQGSINIPGGNTGQDTRGLFPVVFNLATRARISTNATCGEREPEVFCKLVEHVRIFPAENRHCDICDARSEQPAQRHPITNAIDGSNAWWQSPTLTNGAEYNYVTVTLDLGAIYQVAYVIVKAANSPRPGNWVLERSIDGQTYHPWQYFAMTDSECLRYFGMRATIGVPTSLGDDQVICTSRYSKIDPLENGEIFVSIVNGRPGVFQPSRVLLDFTSARYVQLRLLKIRTLNADLMVFEQLTFKDVDPSVTRRYFYSIKDISIGGQCICYGHASYCRRHSTLAERFQCQCLHNTAGDNCELCLPLYNQRPWRTGGIQGLGCEACNCHGKAAECVYNATVDAGRLSLNMAGEYSGGGVCLNCQEFTTGINCEKCLPGYYRPRGYHPSSQMPCRRCRCQETTTSTSQCVPDDSRVDEGLNPGDCICKPGFGGPSCRSCAFGYHGYPNCVPCSCNPAGSLEENACSQPCRCKPAVVGRNCNQCMPGFFNLDRNNFMGCTQCFCFGVTERCVSANWGLSQISDMNDWVLSTVEDGGLTLLARRVNGWLEAKTGYLQNVNRVNVHINPPAYSQYTPSTEVHYWLAPMMYLGNRMSSYGGRLKYTFKFTLDGTLPNRQHIGDPDVILEGGGFRIAYGRQYKRENQDNMESIWLTEDDWYYIKDQQPVSRKDFMHVLYRLEKLMIKATYHTAQDTISLRDVSLDVASPLVMGNHTLPSVEQCQCPEGYAGLSCESCSPGWRREGNQLFGGKCTRCNCHNHASECDPMTGACKACSHSTMGDNCEKCQPGFYGDPRMGTENDCRPCACPLIAGNNFFAESCVANPSQTDPTAYECINCREGYQGVHCERCAPGYYGTPSQPGGLCRKCRCGGNIDHTIPGACDSITGVCKICANNTEGEFCERCQPGYFGSARNGDCRSCACDSSGSMKQECDQRSGQCLCKPRFVGRQCDRCQQGFGDVTKNCIRCSCSPAGSASYNCDSVTGQCRCRSGIGGKNCDRCADGFFGFSQYGCKRCKCYNKGTNNNTMCDPNSGRCLCLSNVTGLQCDKCRLGYYGIDNGKGCSECACDPKGSRDSQCDVRSGQCPCHKGVGGRTCDQCMQGFYGFSSTGCKECPPCTKPGHICDPRTGDCVCPPNTEGPNCTRCAPNSYDYDNLRGCKLCNCTKEGSQSQQCDAMSGVCKCLPAFRGFSCDKCLGGYHGFPSCSACLCNSSGAEPQSCTSGLCECNDNGQCQCKENVVGERCDKCAKGTFSLRPDNPTGCTECYCFLRSQECMQAPYVWSEISVPELRATISDEAKQAVVVSNGFLVINSTKARVDPALKTRPLYWSMPPALLGDLTLSYNGDLEFIHFFDGPIGRPMSLGIFPLMVLRGNGFELYGDTTALEPNHPLTFSIRMHENNWRLRGQKAPVKRRLLMVVLQNVTEILIHAAQDGHATFAEIGPITLQVAKPGKSPVGTDITAYGVEQCKCPDRYSGLSCQDPGIGYTRVKPDPGPNDLQTPETVIGTVRPCHCYSHSDICHPETGKCQNCSHNTTGNHCDRCAPGFYGIATRGTSNDCSPCACPLPEPSNNFSPTCRGVGSSIVCTNCSEGYTGTRCDRCKEGYYGNPVKLGDKCHPCNCSKEGSYGISCDLASGQCFCRPGIQGKHCDKCPKPLQGVQNGTCVSCDEGCTGELLKDLKNLTIPFKKINVTGPYPWEELYRLSNETERLRSKMDALKSTSLDELNKTREQVVFYISVADTLHMRAISIAGDEVDFANSKVALTGKKVNETLHNATDIERIIDELFKEIKGNISELKGLASKLNYHQGLNMTAALKEAQDILDVIMARDFTDADDKAKEEGLEAEELSERVKMMMKRLADTTKVAEALKKIQKALEDLNKQSQQAKTKALELIDERSLKLGSIIADLEDKVMDLEDMKVETEQLLNKGQKLNEEALEATNRLDENIQALNRQLYTLKAATVELEHRFEKMKTAMPHLEKLERDAWKHASELENTAKMLADLFKQVADVAQAPMQAARAYQQIVEAIRQAEAAARKAQKTVDDTVALVKLDDLQDQVKQSLDRSNRLLDKADDLLHSDTRDLDNKLQLVMRQVASIEGKHLNAKSMLTRLTSELLRIPSGFRGRLTTIMGKADRAVDRTVKANQTVSKVEQGIYTDLLPKLKQLKDFDINAIIHNVGKNAEETWNETQTIQTDLPNAKRNSQKNMRLVATVISTNISELRRKIDEARNITNSMKMSLKGTGNCVRSYRSQLGPGITNEIRMGIKLNRTGVNQLVMLLQESPKEFLALEIIDNKVRFSWDVGKGPGSVTHDLELKVFNPKKDEKEKWYRVLAKRVGPIGQLKVWPMKENEGDAIEVTGKSKSGFSLINFNRDTSIYVGGVEDSHKVPAGITKDKMYGSAGDISLDGKPLGVYNFKTTDGNCKANVQVPELPPSTSVYSFNGFGYARKEFTTFNYRSDGFRIQMEFKTFPENARLFFGGNPQSGDFISIDLVRGKLLIQFYLGGMSEARFESNLTYNTNKWTMFNIQRQKLKALVQIFVDGRLIEKTPFSASGPKTGLELMGQKMYVGGLPESFNIDRFTSKEVKDNRNFLGCMRNFGIGRSSSVIPQDLTAGVIVGVSPGCADTRVHRVGFEGNGYVMFDGKSLGKGEADVSLSFFTKQASSLLLLGRDVQSDYYYSIALKDGYLEARLAANSQPTVLRSKETYNDGAVHYVALLKTGRRIRMMVDDVSVAEKRLPSGVDEIPLGENSNLYLGGAPVAINDMAASDVSLDGCISDIIVNGVLVDLSAAKQYMKADIGRCPDSITSGDGKAPVLCENVKSVIPTGLPIRTAPPTTTPTTTTTTTTAAPVLETSTCSPFRLMNAGIEHNAKTLGNSDSSFAKLSNNIRLSELKRNFNISFEFRTFFENGMFGLLKNTAQTVYFVVQLRGGHVEVIYSHEGKEKTLLSFGGLADGKWHRVQIVKNGTRIRTDVDGMRVALDVIGTRLDFELPFYIGSLPPNEELKLNVVKHSLRGCVRNLHLDGYPVDITDTEIISGVEHCYVSTEPGVGFTETSWAIFDSSFDVQAYLELEVEFKTSKREGIMVTFNSKDTGLTLELHDGKVVFGFANKDEEFRAESTNINPNEFCMNQWHTVRAVFNKNTLQLKVDNQPEVFAVAKTVGDVRVPKPAPILIGGYPTTFEKQAASLSKKGFYGCMRNVLINSKSVDWYKLEINSGLLRTACPL